MLTNPTSQSATQLAKDMQLTALSSTPDSYSPQTELRLLCEAAIQALPNEVAKLRAGNKNVINRIVGYVMKQSRGRADATIVRNLVEQIVLREGR
jgi:aspartyl-tRNA(Asn)/glutamyl-tRNA(Gln) amidotransferase subunit B